MPLSGYNERLFQKGVRRHLHLMRFKWLKTKLVEYERFLPEKKILELGCYDGKTLEFLPWRPNKYVCLDANWEEGLNIARNRYGNLDYALFVESNLPEDLLEVDGKFDTFISMETFEHLPTKHLERYLINIKTKLFRNALLFITIPNEIGIVFALKYLVKSVFYRRALHETYTLKEFIYETLGLTDKVKRVEGGHKGFNYKHFIKLLGKYFEILKVEGIPFKLFPYFSFQVGIIAQNTGVNFSP